MANPHDLVVNCLLKSTATADRCVILSVFRTALGALLVHCVPKNNKLTAILLEESELTKLAASFGRLQPIRNPLNGRKTIKAGNYSSGNWQLIKVVWERKLKERPSAIFRRRICSTDIRCPWEDFGQRKDQTFRKSVSSQSWENLRMLGLGPSKQRYLHGRDLRTNAPNVNTCSEHFQEQIFHTLYIQLLVGTHTWKLPE